MDCLELVNVLSEQHQLEKKRKLREQEEGLWRELKELDEGDPEFDDLKREKEK